MLKQPVHAVYWQDASKYDDLPRIITLANGITVGFLLEASREKVIIAQEAFDDGEVRNVVCIPRKMVTAVKFVGHIRLFK